MMPRFRSKVVEIEAWQLTRDNIGDMLALVGGRHWSRPPMRAVTGIIVPTLEGEHQASFGDWIVRGLKGEFYPVKPDIFAMKYDEVTHEQ